MREIILGIAEAISQRYIVSEVSKRINICAVYGFTVYYNKNEQESHKKSSFTIVNLDDCGSELELHSVIPYMKGDDGLLHCPSSNKWQIGQPFKMKQLDKIIVDLNNPQYIDAVFKILESRILVGVYE